MGDAQISSLTCMDETIQKDILENIFCDNSIEVYHVQSGDILFDPYVQLKCQHCINYGSCFRCPPYTPRFYDASSIVRRYQYHYLILMREDKQQFIHKMQIKHKYNLKRAVNFASRNWDVTSYWKFHKVIVRIKDILEEMGKKILVFGPGGGCRLCRICNVHIKERCKHPSESLPSPESWGIDVYGTLRRLGISIEVPPRKVFTRVGLLCSNSKIDIKTTAVQHRIEYKRPDIKRVLDNISNYVGGTLIDIVSLKDYYTEQDLCEGCYKNKLFLCDRTFLPMEYLQEFIDKRKCIVIEFKNKKDLAKSLSEYVDYLHRHGFYDALPFSNYPCNLCDQCSPRGCMLTNQKNPKKFGQKMLFRCIQYLGIRPIVNGNNIGYIVLEA
ncbi:hypothetical protein DRN75_02875 [Nanoarchaeota archaeon]|nr:MAG: hypothetical protein DRN75_02875 [Nanoarchaeota archaeon]